MKISEMTGRNTKIARIVENPYDGRVPTRTSGDDQLHDPDFMKYFILSAFFLFASCNIDTTSVVEIENRLTVTSLFAINDDGRVTLGWTPVTPLFPHAAGGTLSAPGAFVPGGDDPGAPGPVNIYRSDDHDFSPSAATMIATVAPAVNRYTDTNLTNDRTYYYRIVPVGILPGNIEKLGSPSATATGRPYDYGSVTTVGYHEHIERIFASTCAVAGCHASEADGGPVRGLSLESWEAIFDGGEDGAVVVPYAPAKSHLIYHVNSDTNTGPVSIPHMPLPGFDLPAGQVQALISWIAGGCRDDHGAVPFSVFPQGRVLITNQAEDLVAVIDRATNLVARYVRAGVPDVFTRPPEAPHNAVADPARGVYYVNLIGGGKVLKYRIDNNEEIGEVPGILSPTQVAVSSTGDTAYVAQFTPGVNAIKILGTNPLRVIGEVSAANIDKPHGVEITPDGKELWVTGNLSDNIMVVDLSDFSTRLVQLNGQPPGEGGVLLPYQTVMTPDRVYVTCQRGDRVVVVDRQTYEVVKSIPVGLNPLIPSITPDGLFVLVPNRNSNDVSVIDTRVDSVVRTIADVGPQPHGSAVTPDGRFLYVSCENVTAAVPPHHPTVGSKNPGFYTLIDLGTWSVVESFETGAFAAGVVVLDN